tara:strand:+ start:124 stop:513 length:390 start_codon:yes stop_codon:yes gene_type:complete
MILVKQKRTKTGKNKMMVLLQNNSKRTHSNDINALGWGGAIAKYPSVAAAMDTSMDGSKEFDSKTFEFWSKVAEIDTTDLDEAFHIHNCGIEEKITRLASQHSMSIGDILFDGTDYHMVDPEGFAKIAV